MIRYKIVPKKNPVNKVVKYFAVKDGAGAARFMTDQMYKTMSETSNVPLAYIPQALQAIAQSIQMFVLNGHSVSVGELGSFRAILKSKGAPTMEDFNPSYITGVKIAFKVSSPMREILRTTTYQKAALEEDLEELGE